MYIIQKKHYNFHLLVVGMLDRINKNGIYYSHIYAHK